jgi:hypothetical protein
MALYRARFTGSDTGNESVYDFDERDDLMMRPADAVVEAFFAYANRAIFQNEHIEYELRGVMKHTPKDVVVGLGVLYMPGHPDGLPFTIVISPAKMG